MQVAGRGGSWGCPSQGPGIFPLCDEEVIQFAWISLSAAFIKGSHSQANRDTRRSAGSSGDTGWKSGKQQIVKQIRRDGECEQELKKKAK